MIWLGSVDIRKESSKRRQCKDVYAHIRYQTMAETVQILAYCIHHVDAVGKQEACRRYLCLAEMNCQRALKRPVAHIKIDFNEYDNFGYRPADLTNSEVNENKDTNDFVYYSGQAFNPFQWGLSETRSLLSTLSIFLLAHAISP